MIKKRKFKAEAIFQIFILIIGIFAISYLLGSSFDLVSAAESDNGGEDIKGTDCVSGTNKCVGSVLYACIATTWTRMMDCSLSGQLCSSVKGSCEGEADFGFLEGELPDTDVSNLNQPTRAEGVKKIAYRAIEGLAAEEIRKKGTKLIKDVFSNTKEAAEEGVAKKGFAKFLTNLGFTEGVAADIAATAGAIISSAAVAAAFYFGINWLGEQLFADDPNLQALVSQAGAGFAVGYFVGSLIVKLSAEGGVLAGSSFFVGLAAIPGFGWIAAGVGALLATLFYKNKRAQIITYQCNTWQPETGGTACEKCNEQGLIPCSEYQCKSLGQSCELLNSGTTNEKCAFVNRNDNSYPIIAPWQEALLSNNYIYTPANAISPPNKGVYVRYIQSSDGCIPAFTPFSFGVTLNEPARCKISPMNTDSFETMGNLFMDDFFDYNHSYTISMPGAENAASENLTLENGGNFDIYVRCEDAMGNSNPANFVFKYCVSDEPDYTAPVILFADPLNGMPVAYNTEETNVIFYINEPSECRWSHLDTAYENMENSMDCATSVLEMNAYMLYPCTTTLTGIQNHVENNFYVRCRDKPNSTEQRNTNTESFEYTLIGTEPLIIESITPNNTIVKGPTTSVKVLIEAETSAGYKDGEASCYFSRTGQESDYTIFYNTGSFNHSQELWLEEGSYTYYVKCIDLGGNTEYATINFDVEVDTMSPIISRVYNSDDYLTLVTDERAECVYGTASNVGCNYNFDEAAQIMRTNDDFIHYANWNINVDYYIKCKDENNVYPPQNECSIIVRPYEIYD